MSNIFMKVKGIEGDASAGSELSPYFKLLLSDVIISEHHTHAMADVKPVESLRLSFSKIQRSFIGYDKNKQAQAPNTISYDLSTAQMV